MNGEKRSEWKSVEVKSTEVNVGYGRWEGATVGSSHSRCVQIVALVHPFTLLQS